jgi:hypothetical protein
MFFSPRKRIANDRLLFSIRGNDFYLELTGDRTWQRDWT